jgi:hypothetical protein
METSFPTGCRVRYKVQILHWYPISQRFFFLGSLTFLYRSISNRDQTFSWGKNICILNVTKSSPSFSFKLYSVCVCVCVHVRGMGSNSLWESPLSSLIWGIIKWFSKPCGIPIMFTQMRNSKHQDGKQEQRENTESMHSKQMLATICAHH